MNATCSLLVHDDPLCFAKISFPFYYSQKSYLIHGVPDYVLTPAAPVIAYWCFSLYFHALDVSGWKWLEKYRIHDSEEVQARNLATRSEVVWTVLLQQVIQMALGLISLSDKSTQIVSHEQQLRRVASFLDFLAFTTFGERINPYILVHAANFLYWWGIPIVQFLGAMFIFDTWQYFLHRLMHVNKFLYKQVHSWHHRLYVPYAFGSLYNHPLETLFSDSVGVLVTEWMTGISTRQVMLLFTYSTLKTVDDHCGYRFPWDPLQWLSGNNADYHDIHHQAIGVKSNFSQPLFVHWDVLLGTRMTREDIERRRRYKTE